MVREWGRIGCIGFGGPPTHIALLRELCVQRRRWMEPAEFEDAFAACNLLPGPGIHAAGDLLRVAGARPARRAGGRARVHRARSGRHPRPGRAVPRRHRRRAGCSAPAPARARRSPPSRCRPGSGWCRRAGNAPAQPAGPDVAGSRYLIAGALAAATARALARARAPRCGVVELAVRRRPAVDRDQRRSFRSVLASVGGRRGALLVACLGRVQGRCAVLRRRVRDHPADAGRRRRPLPLDDQRPVPQRGRARPDHPRAGRADRRGRRLRRRRPRRRPAAAAVAFAPSFLFVLLGARAFRSAARQPRVRAFLDGAGPAAIGAILGSAVPLARALAQPWQYAVLLAPRYRSWSSGVAWCPR